MAFDAGDREFMAQALALAERGLYTATPNPRVGCVIVKEGAVVGSGWHEKTGLAHAEINALREAQHERDGLQEHPERAGHWYHGALQVLRNRDLWPGFLMMFGAASSYITFAGLWAVPYLMQAHGMSRGTAAGHASIMLLGFALGSIVLGYWSDRSGRRRPLLIGSLALHVACWVPFVIGVALPPAASYALFAALGASVTGFTLAWSCAKELSPPALSGMSTSFVNTGQFIGIGIQQPLVGWILDRGWHGEMVDGVRIYARDDYQLALGVLMAFAAAGLASAFFMRETYCRNVTVP